MIGQSRPQMPAGYTFLRVLGRGGMGVVSLARGAGGALAAIKTLGAQHPGAVASIRREIRALRSVAAPCIVRVLADGVVDGAPWYAMEYLDGRSLAEHMEDPTVDRLQLLGWVAEICLSLAVVHGAGMVHCDIKPDNIIVAAGRPVLVDFGLAARFESRLGRDALEMVGAVTGTPLYMAPERIQGQPFDARADLYAVGCILYEIAVGRPPFDGPGTTPLLQHVARPVSPPSQEGVSVDPFLERLILGLLHKDPVLRPGNALVVADGLRSVGAPTPEVGPPAAPLLFVPPLVGRDAELAYLKARFDDALGGRGSAVALTGPAGIGKTRLLAELVSHARTRRALVVIAHCALRDGPVPYSGVRGLLEPVLDEVVSNQTTGPLHFGGKMRLLDDLLPELRQFPGFAEESPPTALPAEASQGRLVAAALATLRGWIGGRLALLVVDEVHTADVATIAFLRRLILELGSARVLVVMSGRTGQATPEVARLLASREVLPLELEPLRPDDTRRVLSGVLGVAEAPKEFAARVVGTVGGNPWFVVEYARLAVEEGVVTADPSGRWSAAAQAVQALRVPATVAEVAAGRLEHLEPRVRRVCVAAAVLGLQVDVPLLTQVVDVGVDQVRDALGLLRRRGFLEPAGVLSVRFVSEDLHSQALAFLDDRERQRLHRRAASALEERFRAGSPVDRGELGRHWEEAREPRRAVTHLRHAARAASATFAHDAATHWWNHAAALLPPNDPERLEIELDMIEHIHLVRGQHQRSRLLLESYDDLPARGLRLLGRVMNLVGDWEEALPVLQDALAGFQRTGEDAAAAEVVKDMANVLHNQHRTAEAMALYNRALAMVHTFDDPAAEARVLVNIGLVKLRRGQLEEAEATMLHAAELFASVQDQSGRAMAVLNLGIVLRKQERHREALSRYADALEALQRAGNELLAAMVRNNMAIALKYLGNAEAAIPIFDEVAQTALRYDDQARYARARFNQVFSLRDVGREDEALSRCLEVVVIRRQLQDKSGLANALGVAADIQLARGHREEALALVREAQELGLPEDAAKMLAVTVARLNDPTPKSSEK